MVDKWFTHLELSFTGMESSCDGPVDFRDPFTGFDLGELRVAITSEVKFGWLCTFPIVQCFVP